MCAVWLSHQVEFSALLEAQFGWVCGALQRKTKQRNERANGEKAAFHCSQNGSEFIASSACETFALLLIFSLLPLSCSFSRARRPLPRLD